MSNNRLSNIPYKLSISLILLGGLNSFLLGINETNTTKKVIYLLIGVCTLYVLIFHYRRLYLSFLEESVMPPNIFENRVNKNNNQNITLKINDPDAKKVIYWSAKPDSSNNIIKNWQEAYDTYDNSGIVDVINGTAELTYSIPVQYRVGYFDRLLKRHIHYRILYNDGVLSKIYTINLI